jgi:hypothetical protein
MLKYLINTPAVFSIAIPLSLLKGVADLTQTSNYKMRADILNRNSKFWTKGCGEMS